MADQKFMFLIAGIVGVGLVAGLVLAGGGSSADDPNAQPAQRELVKAEKERLKTVTMTAIKTYNETRMALQSCRDFKLRDRFIKDNKLKFAAWNTVRQERGLVDRLARNEITDEELQNLRTHGTLTPKSIDDVGGQLAGLGYGLSYEPGSEKCRDLIKTVRKGNRNLPDIQRPQFEAVS